MKIFPYIVTAVLVVVGVAWFAHTRTTSSEITNDEVAVAVLSYAADPMFSSSNLIGELTGTNVQLELLDIAEDMGAYFSLPRSEDWKLACNRLTKSPEAIEFSQSTESPYQVRDVVLRKNDIYFFRIDSTKFVVDPNARISIPFSGVRYESTARELTDFVTNEVLVGGKQYFVARYQGDEPVYASNFGARVTVPNEPSLSRFVRTLVGEEREPDRIAQKLLDFVTNEIEYDRDEDEWSNFRQVVKRANEVLMTRKATCASKAVLYASLLEQVGGDYILVYSPEHLTVFVSGQHPDSNGLSLVYEGKRYYLAETTVPGFIIGESRLQSGNSSVTSITHFQRPKEKSVPHPKS